MRVIASEPIPILVWGQQPDEKTFEQARHLAGLPFAYHHIALMPDAHVGYGMPIGGVMACDGQVVPNAVGLDIGCGVRAWRTNIPSADLLPLRATILDAVSRAVPQGFDWHRESQAGRTGLFDETPELPVLYEQLGKAEFQLASLGGGNHFVELQEDPDGIVWVMVHSGSRNVGKQVAGHYNRIAQDVNERDGSPVPRSWSLAHLAVDSAEGAEYLQAMEWCLRFALENRRLMAESVQEVLDARFPETRPEPQLDVHHNYAARETHFGREVFVHRKGALLARGTVYIPGSMGTPSYVAEGLANPDAFASCSHGAGRSMARGEAVRRLPKEQVLAGLRERDVVLVKRHLKDVAEEAPEAYKDIEDVMDRQRDLVEPKVRLRPLGVLKG